MRAPRVALFFAGALLVAAEVLSLSLLLKDISEHQGERTRDAVDRAMRLMPRIAEWARANQARPGDVLAVPWIEPFDGLSVEAAAGEGLDEASRLSLDRGEWVIGSRAGDRRLSLLGWVRTDQGPILVRLSEDSVDGARLTRDRTQIAQHVFILLAALAGLILAALIRETPAPADNAPALRAYEEAMLRLRARDDERLAAADREKDALATTLRSHETMARAGELTAGIVHEVRNSLGVIATHAKFAEKASDPRIAEAGASIQSEVRTLQSVMVTFLDFIRTEKVQDVEFDLGKLVGRVASREGNNHSARIELRGASTTVRGDEDLLERAIENVVRNACQASRSEPVVVSYGADGTSAFVIVEDRGRGIEDVSKSLRPFESARPGGLGLGLPLALKILTLHHGTLDLGPGASGVGTQAVLRWPINRPGATSRNA